MTQIYNTEAEAAAAAADDDNLEYGQRADGRWEVMNIADDDFTEVVQLLVAVGVGLFVFFIAALAYTLIAYRLSL